MPIPARLHELMDEHQVDYQVIEHAAAYTASEEAAASHVPGRNWAKAIAVILDSGPALAVLPADRKVDLERLATIAGSHRAALADENELGTLYPDCEPGAMPPFGNLYAQTTFVDESLREDETIAFHAGDHRTAIEIPYQAFADMANPVPGSFSDRLSG